MPLRTAIKQIKTRTNYEQLDDVPLGGMERFQILKFLDGRASHSSLDWHQAEGGQDQERHQVMML